VILPIIARWANFGGILWQGLIAPSMERLIAGASNPGFEFSGLILQAHEEPLTSPAIGSRSTSTDIPGASRSSSRMAVDSALG